MVPGDVFACANICKNILNFKGTHYEYVKLSGSPHFLIGDKKRSRVRIFILLLLSLGTMINYLDRTILGIVAPQLTKEIHIDPAMMGIIFSAFTGPMLWRRSPAVCF